MNEDDRVKDFSSDETLSSDNDVVEVPEDESTKDDTPYDPSEVKESSESYSEEETYEVEEILDFRVRGTKRQFWVKWKNHPLSSNTWENEENLECKDLIDDYIKACVEIPPPRKEKKVPVGMDFEIFDAFQRRGEEDKRYYSIVYANGVKSEMDTQRLISRDCVKLLRFLERNANIRDVE